MYRCRIFVCLKLVTILCLFKHYRLLIYLLWTYDISPKALRHKIIVLSLHSDVEDSFDQGEFPYQTFVSKQNALSMPRSGYKWRSKRRGIVDECCRQSCTVAELRQYCGTEDDWTAERTLDFWTVERTPCDWTQSRLKQMQETTK